MKTQEQIFYEESRKIADSNLLFLEMAGEMTNEELQKLIELRPNIWGRMSNSLEFFIENT